MQFGIITNDFQPKREIQSRGPMPKKDRHGVPAEVFGCTGHATRNGPWATRWIFQRDFQIYAELIARQRLGTKNANHLKRRTIRFVDRCAFLLDSSLLEKARVAGKRAPLTAP